MNTKTVLTTTCLIAVMVVSAIVSIPISSAASMDDSGTWQDEGNYDTSWYADNSESETFMIYDAADLAGLAKLVNEETADFSGLSISLEDDIDLSAHEWVPIGSDSNDGFHGSFDGNGYTISGMTITATSDDDPVGLFGKVYVDRNESNTISDLTLTDVSIASEVDVGGIIGQIEGRRSQMTMVNCHVSGFITLLQDDSGDFPTVAGGLVGSGRSIDIIIEDCFSDLTINVEGQTDETTSGATSVGGIAGSVSNITIRGCVNNGDITAVFCGGIVGNVSSGTIENCVNNGGLTSVGGRGTVLGATQMDSQVGGIASDSSESTISGCINNGSIKALEHGDVGGIVGNANISITSDCTNNGRIDGGDRTGGIIGSNHANGRSADIEGSISDSSNRADIRGYGSVGGIVGSTSTTASSYPNLSNIVIRGCFNTGNLTGGVDTSSIGGIIGYNNDTSPTSQRSYYPFDVEGCINTGDLPAGAGGIVGTNKSFKEESSTERVSSVQDCYWPSGTQAIAANTGEASAQPTISGSGFDTETGALDDDSGGHTNISEIIKDIIGEGSQTFTFEIRFSTEHGTAPGMLTATLYDTVVLPSIEADGYDLLAWTDGLTTYVPGSEVIVMSDMTLTAVWESQVPNPPFNDDDELPPFIPSQTGGDDDTVTIVACAAAAAVAAIMAVFLIIDRKQ